MDEKITESFTELTETEQEGSKEFIEKISEKNFHLDSSQQKYLVHNKQKETEVVEAVSAEEALTKTSLKDIVKIEYLGKPAPGKLIDNNSLQS